MSWLNDGDSHLKYTHRPQTTPENAKAISAVRRERYLNDNEIGDYRNLNEQKLAVRSMYTPVYDSTGKLVYTKSGHDPVGHALAPVGAFNSSVSYKDMSAD